MTLRRSLLVAGVLAGALVPADAQERKLPAWQPTVEAALAAARSKGQAVMVALNMDNERGNQGMLDDVYTSQEVLDATQVCVPVIASMFQHRLMAGPGGKQVCERFGSVTCDEHRAVEKTIRIEWLGRTEKDEVESPRHFFLAPNGKILFQRVWTMDAKSLAALMRRASELCTPERLAAWDTLDGQFARVTDPIATVREMAVAELLALEDPAVDARLLKLAKDSKDGNVVGSILGAFARAESAEQRELAIDGLSHKLPEARMFVAYEMQRSEREEYVKPLLARASKEKDGKAKGAMLRALGVLAKDDKAAKKVILAAAGSTKDPARAHAAIAIAPWAKDKDVQKTLQEIVIQGGSQTLRSAAVWSLGFSESKEIGDQMEELHASLSMREWRVRMAADAASKRLRGRDVPGYERSGDLIVPHPVNDDGKSEAERDRPPGW